MLRPSENEHFGPVGAAATRCLGAAQLVRALTEAGNRPVFAGFGCAILHRLTPGHAAAIANLGALCNERRIESTLASAVRCSRC